MPRLTYRPEIDGLRAVAVLLVVAFHAHLASALGGYVGVDLFFVLSGFLVTGVLVGELGEAGRISVGRFYARRVRRLLPAAVVVVVVTGALQLLVLSQPARLELVDDARAALLYVANWHYITESRDYFAQDVDSSPFLHFWSLSIEEQFYIAFPLVVALGCRLSKHPVRLLTALIGTVVVVSLALQVWRASQDVTYAYYATETRIYQLAVGSLLMLVLLHRADRQPAREADHRAGPTRSPRVATGLAVAGLVVVLFAASGLTAWSASSRGITATLGSVLLLVGLWEAPRGPLARLLALPVPRYVGQISYGVYLWHWPVLLLLERVFELRPSVLALLTVAVSTGLASLSFQLLEQPVRRGRVLRRLPWPVVAIGLATSVLVAAYVVAPVLQADRRPALTAQRGPDVSAQLRALDRPVPADLDLVAARADIGPVWPRCTPDDPDACTIVDRESDDATHVVLVGDSQAQTLGTAFEHLARERGWKLSAAITSGCPWQAGQVSLREQDRATLAECREQRETFYADVLPQLDADVVVVFGLPRSDGYWAQNLGPSVDEAAGPDLDEFQTETTLDTADSITAAGAQLVIVESVFGTEGYTLTGFDPLECLSTARRVVDCGVTPPLERPAVDGVYDYLSGSQDDVATIDLDPIVCPDRPVCSPVDGRTVVWRDKNHITATYFDHHRGDLLKTLRRTGFFGS